MIRIIEHCNFILFQKYQIEQFFKNILKLNKVEHID